MPEYSEEEIIAGCRNQKRAFQEQLYKQYYSLFLKICARYARDMQDAEQLINDGFLKIFSRIHTYSGTGSFEGWMKRIMVNTCLDYLKSKELKSGMQLHYGAGKMEDTLVAPSATGLDNIEFKELVALIQSLPAMTRTVFNLYVFEGMSHKEITGVLPISEGTSHWHVHQARHQLQKKIKSVHAQNPLYASKRV